MGRTERLGSGLRCVWLCACEELEAVRLGPRDPRHSREDDVRSTAEAEGAAHERPAKAGRNAREVQTGSS